MWRGFFKRRAKFFLDFNIKRNSKNSFCQRNDGQLLLLGGVMITVFIVALAVISISLSDINIPIDKKSFIKLDFDNARREFGVALQDRLEDKSSYINYEDIVSIYFNDTRDIFIFAEGLRGNCFDAVYLGISYKFDNSPDTILVGLSLSNKNDYIYEEVKYGI
jgi:hypothetical protein